MNKTLSPKLKLPRKLALMAGAHLILPGSTKGGPGKSSTIITTAAACKMVGLPYIVASYDQTNSALERSLGDGVVVTLDAQTPELARSTLSAVTSLARKTHSLILLDIPGAMNHKASVLLDNIKSARVMERCESLSFVLPVSPDPEELEGACKGIEIFEPDRILLRARKPSRHAPAFESFGKPWEYLQQFPMWNCEQWTQTQKDIITRSGSYAYLPPVPNLAAYLTDNFGKISEVEELDIEDVVHHVEIAAAALYEHILAPITTIQSKKSEETAVA